MPLIAWAILAHIVADWFLQSEYLALNKTKWNHPAAWIHSGLHFVCLLFVFPFAVSMVVAVAHFVIDLRFILVWWRRMFDQTTEGPMAIHVSLWQDQCAHFIVLAIACWWMKG